MATGKSPPDDDHSDSAAAANLAPADQHEEIPCLFSTTQWSLVLTAADSQNPDAREALAILCQTYWYPVYALVRHTSRSADEAQDLTQGFFAHLLEKEIFKVARPERGRFRFFLRSALRHHLSHERRKEKTRKRGGGQPTLALDFAHAEARYALESADRETPEKAFEERWAKTLLTQALERLRGEMLGATGRDRLHRLESFLTGWSSGPSYKQVAEQLEMSESAVKVTVHRMRRRFGELLREEVARTVDGPDQVDEEIRYLFSVLG
jgi:RNA polymerase sigma-70 factor (ECF subfamily)